MKKEQEQRIIEKIIEKTPIQKVKVEKEVQPRVYEKRAVEVNRSSNKIKEAPSKA